MLDDHSEPQPDIALLRPRPDYYLKAHPRAADVLLLIEVSDSTVRFDRTPADIRRHAPALGEHTDEILTGLGCDPTEIRALREARVVA